MQQIIELMKRRCYIHKGIQKRITAIGRRFVVGTEYTASIYNPKDTSIKITSTAVCVELDDKNRVAFVFSGEQTDSLKVGYATIEIYDNNRTTMAVRDNFAIIRKNSLPITPYEIEEE